MLVANYDTSLYINTLTIIKFETKNSLRMMKDGVKIVLQSTIAEAEFSRVFFPH